jgi:ADP-ribose pyrophosphatase YjhB (NUDIX family)
LAEQFQPHSVTLTVAALIADREKRLLMVREAQPDCYGLWNQPAGHVDAGESITDALLREVKEETGYANVRIDGISRVYYFVNHALLRINFAASLLDRVQGPLADDVLETGWFSAAELSEMSRQGQLRSKRTELAIRDWLEGQTSSPGIIQTVVEETLDRVLF